jgi:polar amino acid transport system substrate-binding protein
MSPVPYRVVKIVLLALLAGSFLVGLVSEAVGAEPPDQKIMIVGLANDPPFTWQRPDGTWTGISVDLWQSIAETLHFKYEYRATSLPGRIDGLRQHWLDVGIGPITITSEREEVCDFTHAYFVADLGVAVPGTTGTVDPVNAVLRSPLFWGIVKLVASLLVAISLVALIVWLCERKTNWSQFGGRGKFLHGFGSSLWWSAVTMAGVGYGDIVPKGLIGRIWAILWMLASLVLVSIFTAAMASILTTAQLANSSDIQHLDDLRRVHVGSLPGSTSAEYLGANHIKYANYSDLQSLLQALAKGKINAAVYDKPILVYEIQNNSAWHLKVLSLRFGQQLYGFTLPEGSPLRESINRVLLAKIHDPSWKALIDGYLGSDYRP